MQSVNARKQMSEKQITDARRNIQRIFVSLSLQYSKPISFPEKDAYFYIRNYVTRGTLSHLSYISVLNCIFFVALSCFIIKSKYNFSHQSKNI